MKPNTKLTTRLLYVTEGVGAIFVALFAVAYLGGLATNNVTNVLHSEPYLRIPLAFFGAILVVLTLIIAAIAGSNKER